jgi:hypothetical protein
MFYNFINRQYFITVLVFKAFGLRSKILIMDRNMSEVLKPKSFFYLFKFTFNVFNSILCVKYGTTFKQM